MDQVQIPKGSFYNYFDSKEDFGIQVIWHYANQFAVQLEAALAKTDVDALTTLKEFFQDMMRQFEDKGFQEGCLVGNLAGEVADTSEASRTALADVLADWQDRFCRVLSEAQKQGSVRNDIPAETLAHFLLNSWEGSLLRMKVEKSVHPLQQSIQLMLDVFFRA